MFQPTLLHSFNFEDVEIDLNALWLADMRSTFSSHPSGTASIGYFRENAWPHRLKGWKMKVEVQLRRSKEMNHSSQRFTSAQEFEEARALRPGCVVSRSFHGHDLLKCFGGDVEAWLIVMANAG